MKILYEYAGFFYNWNMHIRRADIQDVQEILDVIEDGRHSLHAQHIDQWQNGYPAETDIINDIKEEGGYVIVEQESIAGYCFIQEMQDPCYRVIENGRWLNENPYIVLHRTCILTSYKGKGCASLFVKQGEILAAEKKIHNLRADTHENNYAMRHMLEGNGFMACGTVYMKDHSPRIGYQKIL